MGRLGKPQKSRKNRKLKVVGFVHPGKRGDRCNKLKDARPDNEYEQEMPRKVKELIRLKEIAKDLTAKQRKKNQRKELKSFLTGGKKSGFSKAEPSCKHRKEESSVEFKKRECIKKHEVPEKRQMGDKSKMQLKSGAIKKNYGTKEESGNNKKRGLRCVYKDKQATQYKMRELMELKEMATDLAVKKTRKYKKAESESFIDGTSGPLEPEPKFKQWKGESDRSFMRRVWIHTSTVLERANIEEKFKIQFDLKSGVMKKQHGINEKKKERRKQRALMKKKKKREKKDDKKTGFEHLKDENKFGEFVTKPPSLTAKPTNASKLLNDPPGKASLLLNKILVQNSMQNPNATTMDRKRKLGETVRWKHLSPARQCIMSAERDRAIELYRQQKQQKHS